MAYMRLTTEAAKNWLTWVRSAGLSSAYGYVRLYKSTYDPTCDSTFSNFTSNECNFDGYAAQQATSPAAPVAYGSCGARLPLGSAVFTFTAGGTPTTDTAGGAFYTDVSNSYLLGYVPFDSDFTFDSVDDSLTVAYDLCLVTGCGAP